MVQNSYRPCEKHVCRDVGKIDRSNRWCDLGELYRRFAENPFHFAIFGAPASQPGNTHAKKSRSCRHRGHQLRKSNDIQNPPEIISQSSQAELTSNLLQAAHQKRPLVHPLLDGSKRMFDRLAAAIEHIGACIRSKTASFSRRETVRNLPPVQCERILQSSHASLLR